VEATKKKEAVVAAASDATKDSEAAAERYAVFHLN